MKNLDNIFTNKELDIQIVFNPYNRKGVVIFKQAKLKQYFKFYELPYQMLVQIPNAEGKFLKLVYSYETALSLRVDLLAPKFYRTGFAEWDTRGLEHNLIQIVSTDDEFKLVEDTIDASVIEGRDLTNLVNVIATKLDISEQEVFEGNALLLYLFISRHICPIMMQGEGDLYEVDVNSFHYIGRLYLDVGIKDQSNKILDWVENRVRVRKSIGKM